MKSRQHCWSVLITFFTAWGKAMKRLSTWRHHRQPADVSPSLTTKGEKRRARCWFQQERIRTARLGCTLNLTDLFVFSSLLWTAGGETLHINGFMVLCFMTECWWGVSAPCWRLEGWKPRFTAWHTHTSKLSSAVISHILEALVFQKPQKSSFTDLMAHYSLGV